MCGILAFIFLKSTENTQLLVPFLFAVIVTVDDRISDSITKLFFFPRVQKRGDSLEFSL